MIRHFPANPPEKAGYQLEFNEDFSGAKLNTQHWLPYYLPQWCSREQSAANYELTGHSLLLKIDKEQPYWPPQSKDQLRVSSLQTGVFSGPVGSTLGQHRIDDSWRVAQAQVEQRLYTPQYGYFEIRAKALATQNNVCALWMIGFEDQPERSGEICIMEVNGAQVQPGSAMNGYGVKAFNDPKLHGEFYQDRFEIEAPAFNIYAAEWRPGRVDFYINNLKVRSIPESPDYPMQLMLNVYETPVDVRLKRADLQYPKRFEVDYIRVFQPVGGY